MYIPPNTGVIILQRVPLDMTYDHTLYFESEFDQHTYFARKRKFQLPNQYYQRANRNYIRVEIRTEDLYDCNYLMFRNEALGKKWFYAFITEVNYINNKVTEIEYVIDVMQTWYFDYELEQCFIERQHTETDNVGDNLIQEDLDLGDDYVDEGVYWFTDISKCTTGVILATRTPDNLDPVPSLVYGVYCPLYIKIGKTQSEDPEESLTLTIQKFINNGIEDAIVCVYMIPDFISDINIDDVYAKPLDIPSRDFTIDRHDYTYFGDYHPKNNKMYTWPYLFINVTSSDGTSANFKFENFLDGGGIANFRIAGVPVTTPVLTTYPLKYLTTQESVRQLNDIEYALYCKAFPVCAWGGDLFKAWWAQNKTGVVLDAVTDAFGLMKATGSKEVGRAQGVLLADVTNFISTAARLNATPPQVHGKAQTDTLLQGLSRLGFRYYVKAVKPYFAQVIDEFFTRFGYAIHTTRKPNIHARQEFTYIKTVGCMITHSIPQDAITAICNIYDNGITFWVNPDHVGDYSVDNKLLTERSDG